MFTFWQSICILENPSPFLPPLPLSPLISLCISFSPLPLLPAPRRGKFQKNITEDFHSHPLPLSPSPHRHCSCLQHGWCEHSHLASPPGCHLSVPDLHLMGQGPAASRTQTYPHPGKPAATSLPRPVDLTHQGAGDSPLVKGNGEGKRSHDHQAPSKCSLLPPAQ